MCYNVSNMNYTTKTLNKINNNQVIIGLIAAMLAVFSASLLAPTASAATPTYPGARWIVPEKPRAVVIMLHGGSWFGRVPNQQDSMVTRSERMSAKARVITMNIDYDSGVGSFANTATAYDVARQKFPNLPICLFGSSAGGNIALIVATQRPVDCVISEAGPTDLNTTESTVRESAKFLLGESRFVALSPLYASKQIKAPTLLVNATNDPKIPYASQAVAYKKKYPKVQLVTLRPGDGKGDFVHSKVDSVQLAKAENREASLVVNVASKYQLAKKKAAKEAAAKKKAAQKRAAQQNRR